MSNPLLDCKDVIKIYQSSAGLKIPALRGIDLVINEADLVVLIGPSGSGKTTFVNVLGLMDGFSSGEITYNGSLGQLKYSEATFKEKIRFRRELFGYLLQLPEKNLLFRLTALQNVLFPMRVVGKLAHEAQKKQAIELLNLLNLGKRIHHRPAELSGGEAQRLAICVSLANDPQIILADEPTGELDSLNTFSIMRYFKELNDNLGKTFVIVTHDIRFISIVDFAYKIQDGKITTIYQPGERSPIDKTEYTYVSELGEFVLPKRIRQKYQIEKMVKLESEGDHIIVTHPDRKRKSSQAIEEYTYVTESGALIIPLALRNKCNIKKKIRFEETHDSFKIHAVQNFDDKDVELLEE